MFVSAIGQYCFGNLAVKVKLCFIFRMKLGESSKRNVNKKSIYMLLFLSIV